MSLCEESSGIIAHSSREGFLDQYNYEIYYGKRRFVKHFL